MCFSKVKTWLHLLKYSFEPYSFDALYAHSTARLFTSSRLAAPSTAALRAEAAQSRVPRLPVRVPQFQRLFHRSPTDPEVRPRAIPPPSRGSRGEAQGLFFPPLAGKGSDSYLKSWIRWRKGRDNRHRHPTPTRERRRHNRQSNQSSRQTRCCPNPSPQSIRSRFFRAPPTGCTATPQSGSTVRPDAQPLLAFQIRLASFPRVTPTQHPEGSTPSTKSCPCTWALLKDNATKKDRTGSQHDTVPQPTVHD